MTKEILRVEGLKKNFGKLEVLKGISTSITKGEVVSVIGPSGGGKSTFLRCLNLLEEPSEGKIFFKGEEITGKKIDVCKYRQQMGMVFQNFNVFPNMTVLENITLAPILERKIPKAEAEEEASATRPMSIPASCPAVRSRGSPLSGRWQCTRRLCSLTSLPLPLTRRWSRRF